MSRLIGERNQGLLFLSRQLVLWWCQWPTALVLDLLLPRKLDDVIKQVIAQAI
jgi:hypothetical protein